MADEVDARPWEELEQIADLGSVERLEEFLESLPTGDAVRALARLSDEGRAKVLTTLEPQDAADLIEDIPDVQAVELLEQIEPPEAAAIVSELPSNEQADVISALDAADAQAVLAEMAPEQAAETMRLAAYAPDTAGGIMVTEFVSYPHTTTVQDVIEDLHARGAEYTAYEVQYAYIVSSRGALVGVLRLRDLLLAPRERPVSDVMIRDPLAVPDDTTLDGLAEFFDAHAFLGVPVTDCESRLTGVVRRHDVEAALTGRSESDFLKAQGIVGGDELRTMPLHRRSIRRLSWLSINIVLNVIAASVIALYEDTIASVIALAVFLPIISDMSGCSGNQAVAVSIRELTLGLIKPHELFYVLFKEIRVGVINGLVLGLILGAVAWMWKGNTWLGLVAGAALALNTIVAVCIGGAVPLLLKRRNHDPALASGPILTTVTDMCGFFLVLSLATLLLPKLVGG
ncbi:MAG: magnesium transporter [Planctomycetota bacterium]|jgi:magnesium transporter